MIVAIMGYVVGAITEKHHGLGFDALAIVAACVIKVVGYYIAEGIIYGNWIAPFTSIPGNLENRCCSRCGSDRYRAASQSSKQNHF